MKAKLEQGSYSKLLVKLKTMEKYSKAELQKDIFEIGLNAALKSKMTAPVDTGNLKRLISAQKVAKGVEIFSKAPYSPYMEFGTGRYVDVSDLKDLGFPGSYAKQFKCKGIKSVNIQPQPYFFSGISEALEVGKKKIKDKLKKLT